MPGIQKNDFWLRLDNAAKIYPAIKDKELTSVFRISVVLKDRIRAKAMLEAVSDIENRFPYYKVTLKAGFFWYYLEQLPDAIPIEADLQTPCRAFKKGELMFRILVKDNRISVEFSHILTDGTGAFEFLKTLLLVYFEKCCIPLAGKPEFYDPDSKPSAEEYEDAYSRYFKKIDAPHIKTPGAFHVPFSLKNKPRFSVLTAIIPIAELSKKAKLLGVSITVYLTAIYLYTLQHIHEYQPRLKKNINRKILRIEVPLNLRKLYPTRSMRNFSLYVLPQIDLRLGHYTFEEIVKTVYHQMQLETDQKLINKMISRNVGGERNAIVRNIPLVLKSLFLSRLYLVGTKQYSGVVTNLGKIDLGTAANQLIEQFIFIPPPPNKVLKVNCGVAGFGDNLVLSFGNITTSKELERHFLAFMAHHEITVKIINS
ncbi:hypothetical protein [Chitinophaga sp. OAE865]|uniref:hypothetical protein n=1 Tax=Chitinophaga sp. OAE865 TaxID=2817898 RepID=UPI001AE87BD8